MCALLGLPGHCNYLTPSSTYFFTNPFPSVSPILEGVLHRYVPCWTCQILTCVHEVVSSDKVMKRRGIVKEVYKAKKSLMSATMHVRRHWERRDNQVCFVGADWTSDQIEKIFLSEATLQTNFRWSFSRFDIFLWKLEWC